MKNERGSTMLHSNVKYLIVWQLNDEKDKIDEWAIFYI